ncbi:short-chain dehydrogenase/reductase family protein [Favolaschia claudopus]|uniref:Short-chain dehydrogenase/reductase family protein n=1 Tax=Favolaschia claudopus TaxID=2862362 RepID=A0AAW0AMV6_9AGAR
MTSTTLKSLNGALFSSTARIYNLRALLLVTIILIPVTVITRPRPETLSVQGLYTLFYIHYAVIFGLVTCGFVLAHHIFRLCTIFRLNAVFDWILGILEVSAVAFIVGLSGSIWPFAGSGFNFALIARCVQLTCLLLSQIWATAAIMSSSEHVLRQRSAFFAGCTPCRRSKSYTLARILFNRSAGEQHRGEYSGIALVRGLVLAFLCLLFPTIAVYDIVISPLQAKVYTRPIQLKNVINSTHAAPIQSIVSWGPHVAMFNLAVRMNGKECQSPSPMGLEAGNSGFTIVPGAAHPRAWTPDQTVSYWHCAPDTDSEQPAASFLAKDNLQVDSFTGSGPVYLQIGQENNFDDIIQYTAPIAMWPGNSLVSTLTWTQYRVVDPGIPLLLGSLASMRTFVIAELHTSDANQSDPRLGLAPSSSHISNLIIYQPSGIPVKAIEEYTEFSALGGFATVGGLWTFINGAFSLFFGANVLYFLFGHRPLSALGIVHIFQRDRLVRQWHEDYPALRTEGGMPRSENAGIVAFLRERLVDLEGGESISDFEDEDGASANDMSCKSGEREFEMNEDTTKQGSLAAGAEVKDMTSGDRECSSVGAWREHVCAQFEEVSLLGSKGNEVAGGERRQK